jgi:hypothetical protein
VFGAKGLANRDLSHPVDGSHLENPGGADQYQQEGDGCCKCGKCEPLPDGTEQKRCWPQHDGGGGVHQPLPAQVRADIHDFAARCVYGNTRRQHRQGGTERLISPLSFLPLNRQRQNKIDGAVRKESESPKPIT